VTRKRLAAWILVSGVCIVSAVAALTAFLFIWPRTDAPEKADAIVVFGGEHRERLAEGLELARRDIAPILVISDAPELGEGVCAKTRDGVVEVVCLEPEPRTTRGEAQEVSNLAVRRGWRSLVLVTSTYHVTRARMLLGRCYPGKLSVVGADADEGFGRTADRLTHEWGGYLYALLFARSC